MSKHSPRKQTYYPRTAALAPASPTCIDLFSGAGGLAEGFRQAGFRILSGADEDLYAAETFRLNFPEASFFARPIRLVRGDQLLRDAGLERGDLDCLIGGPPCQAFSYNNHQRTHKSIRAGLFRSYLRLVRDLFPKVLVMENVPGILTIGDGAVVEEIYESLGELGYECRAKILYAEDFGIPQERRRVFFVASRIGWSDAFFPEGTHGPFPKPDPRSNPYVHHWQRRPGVAYGDRRAVTVWGAIGDLPALLNGGSTEGRVYVRPPRTQLQKKLRGRERNLQNHSAPLLHQGTLERMAHVPQGGSWRDIPFELLPAGMQRARRSDHTKRYGRLHERGLCCTILTKCDPHWGSYFHPRDERAISVREAARLQSFPDRFVFMGPQSRQFVQVGNAVPPLLAAGVAQAVRNHLEEVAAVPAVAVPTLEAAD
jgi:DNA (cytosine-5)-methyltransferase 1